MKKIYLIGDSLMQDYNYLSYPQYGYGSIFRMFVKEDIEVVNLAHAGCSTKSFIEQDRFKAVTLEIKEGDLLIIEFGNNDEKINDPKRYTNKDKEFLENIRYFYDTAIKNKANALILTSPTRLTIENNILVDSHLGYPETLYKYALSNNLNVIDLNEITKKIYNFIGLERAKEFHLIYPKGKYYRFNDGVNDTSHYNYKGATLICFIVLYYLQKFEFYDNYFVNLDETIKYNSDIIDKGIYKFLKQ